MRTWMSAGIQAVCGLGDEAIPGMVSTRSITVAHVAVLACREHTFTNHGSQKVGCHDIRSSLRFRSKDGSFLGGGPGGQGWRLVVTKNPSLVVTRKKSVVTKRKLVVTRGKLVVTKKKVVTSDM